MTGWKRFVIGGFGGLAPVIALLLAIDLELNLADATTSKVLGYCVRVIALFAVGGFIAWLHESEVQLFKLFEIGVGAPALLAGLITSQSIVPPRHDIAVAAPKTTVGWWIPLGAANAQASTAPHAAGLKFSAPVQTGSAGFFEGLVGSKPENVYYVIVGSHATFQQAEADARAINARGPSFHAKVYAPFGGNPYYTVVIGEHLVGSSASELRARAVAAGMRNTTVWSPAGR